MRPDIAVTDALAASLLSRLLPALELLAEPILSICCFRVKPKDVSDEAALGAIGERALRSESPR
jgi:glutamate/tyrosine decarboxylase-like PLP-dependent enzyme